MNALANNAPKIPPLTLIKAGAGAGKTYRIQQVITEWIKSQSVSADKILAVTFTKAAANEMKERIRQNLIQEGMRLDALKLENSTLSTIHGFGLNLIEQFAYSQGISPVPRQLNEGEQTQLIRQSLIQVTALQPLLDDLKRHGFQQKFNGSSFSDSVSQLKNQVLSCVNNLRALGKEPEEGSAEALALLKATEDSLRQVYGLHLAQADTLNKALWQAIEAIRATYDEETLLAEWGSNTATRNFVKAIWQATEAKLATDWKLWVKLQTIGTAPKIRGKKKEHEQAALADAVWQAADKLAVHPGPLKDSIQQAQALLSSAIEVLSIYQALKVQAGLVDYGDLIQIPETILNNEAYLQEAIADYDCLIIDEFQDTNPLQFSLLRQFQKAGLPTLIVGDLKQSIMGFQGADARLFSGLLTAGEQDDNITVDELTSNWRSTPDLMQFINAMGSQLYSGYQALSPAASYQSDLKPVQKLIFDTKSWGVKKSKNKASINDEGAYALAHHLSELLVSGTQVTDKHTQQKRPIRPSDIAVLGRTNNRLMGFAGQLAKVGVKTKVAKEGFLETEAVQWVLSAMQYVANPTNNYALLNLLTSDYAGVSVEEALQEYIEHKCFSHNIVDTLSKSAYELRLLDFKGMILGLIDLLDVWTHLEIRADFEQQRANIIKLISLSESFEATQPESLQSMGIYGKNLDTFWLWLQENKNTPQEDVIHQPHVALNADDAVVLTTWHASKGLEWPVVLLLDTHESKSPFFPAIDMAYQTDDIDSMLDSSYVRLLTKFDDPTAQQKVLDVLEDEQLSTLKNLTYVTLTRAREQLILPWFEDYKDNSLLSLIAPVFDDVNLVDDVVESKNMVMIDEVELVSQAICLKRLKLAKQAVPEAVQSVISPSKHESLTEDGSDKSALSTSKVEYGEALNLMAWDLQLPANEVGDIVHRLFEVVGMNEALLPKAIQQLPEALQDAELLNNLSTQLKNHQGWVKANLQPLEIQGTQGIQCEVSVLARNELGQTISGSIDMLVETEQGYWIIDHKTDKAMVFEKHLAQIESYAQSLNLAKPILGLAINWVRQGVVESLSV